MAKKIDSTSDLRPDATNANKGTQRGRGMVEASLRETGAGRSILANRNGNVIAGNKTLEAWVDIGGEIEVVRTDGKKLVVVQREDLDLSDDTGMARKLAYYDNRASEVGLEWDTEQLLADLNAGVDLSSMFRQDELDELLADLLPEKEAQDVAPQIDKAEELRQKWQVETGQLWQLGEHRLICGDCTDASVVARVMDGEKAALTVTSPPYGVGKDYEAGGLNEWKQTVSGMLAAASSICPLLAINLGDVKVGPNHREVHTYGLLIEMCKEVDRPLIGTRVWTKQPAWAQGPYWLSSYRAADDFEYIGIFGETEHKDRTQEDWRYRGTWEMTSVSKNDLHSAMFPLELPERLIKLLSDDGAIVYEPFSGSGTTIIACEQLGRKCRAVEISPAYVAVALQRWADATGKTPVLLDS